MYFISSSNANPRNSSLGDGFIHTVRTHVVREPASLLILVLLLTVMYSQTPCGSKRVARSFGPYPSRFQLDRDETVLFSPNSVYWVLGLILTAPHAVLEAITVQREATLWLVSSGSHAHPLELEEGSVSPKAHGLYPEVRGSVNGRTGHGSWGYITQRIVAKDPT